MHVHVKNIFIYKGIRNIFLCVQISGDLEKFGSIRSRFAGQIYDSPCELTGIREGVIRSLSNSKAVQQQLLKALE